MGTHEFHDTSPQIDVLIQGRREEGPRDFSIGRTQKLSSELVRRIRVSTAELQVQFAAELNERALAREASRLFAHLLQPKVNPRGRPRSTAIDAACELRKNGVPWKHIPWKVLPGFGKLSRSDQSFALERLRRAVYMRQKRGRVTNLIPIS